MLRGSPAVDQYGQLGGLIRPQQAQDRPQRLVGGRAAKQLVDQLSLLGGGQLSLRGSGQLLRGVQVTAGPHDVRVDEVQFGQVVLGDRRALAWAAPGQLDLARLHGPVRQHTDQFGKFVVLRRGNVVREDTGREQGPQRCHQVHHHLARSRIIRQVTARGVQADHLAQPGQRGRVRLA